MKYKYFVSYTARQGNVKVEDDTNVVTNNNLMDFNENPKGITEIKEQLKKQFNYHSVAIVNFIPLS